MHKKLSHSSSQMRKEGIEIAVDMKIGKARFNIASEDLNQQSQRRSNSLDIASWGN